MISSYSKSLFWCLSRLSYFEQVSTNVPAILASTMDLALTNSTNMSAGVCLDTLVYSVKQVSFIIIYDITVRHVRVWILFLWTLALDSKVPYVRRLSNFGREFVWGHAMKFHNTLILHLSHHLFNTTNGQVTLKNSLICVSTDINECSSNPCYSHGFCVDRINGFTCICFSGYTGLQCQAGSRNYSTK